MANVKNKVKAHKDASKTNNKKQNKETKSLTGLKEKGEMRQLNDFKKVKRANTKDKIKFIVQNDQLIADNEISQLRLGKPRVTKKNLSSYITRNCIVSKSGRIKTGRSKDSFKILDHILKSELNIEDSNTSDGRNWKDKIVNNNDTETTDQNTTITIDEPSAPSPEVETIEIDEDTEPQHLNEEIDVSPKQTPKKTKAKKTKSPKKDNSKAKTPKVVLETRLTSVPRVNSTDDTELPSNHFECDYCKIIFSSKSTLRRHILVHLKIKPYKCKVCRKKFAQRSNLVVHVSRVHPRAKCPGKRPCRHCNKSFNSKDELQAHMEEHFQRTYKCLHCDQVFNHHLMLIDHEKEHNLYLCPMCGYQCESRQQFATHVKSHEGNDFICYHCGKEFLRPNSIRRHVQVCHAGVTIQCPVCHKKLKGHLTEHMRTHQNARPHKCPDCGQCFTQSTQLTVHRRNHTGDRPYPCRICGRPFSHSNALMLHIRRHTGEKPFQCAMCPLTFSQLPHMKAHMRNIHGKDNPYKCGKCGLFFKLKSHLELHKRKCDPNEVSVGTKVFNSLAVYDQTEDGAPMTLSRMRFLLALLLTMIASKEKLKFLGFNKRLIDDLLVESLEAMGHLPCKNASLTPLQRLRTNIEVLMHGTVPEQQMKKFKQDNKTTEELLELLTDDKGKIIKKVK